MDKTIKQLADDYGISKQAVRKHINKLPTDCYYVASNKTIYVTEKGQQIVRSKVSTTLGKKVSTNAINPLVIELQQKIAILELEKELQNKSSHEKIELMQAELGKRDKEIDNLLKLLDQSQKLHAMAEQKLQLLEDKQTPKKHRFFSRS